MSERLGLRDPLLEKNEISDNFHGHQQSIMIAENSTTGSLQTKHSKTAWVYGDEDGKQFFEKQISEDDISSGRLKIPSKLADYINSLKLKGREDNVEENTRTVTLVCDSWENECYFTGQWMDFVKQNQLKTNENLVVLEVSKSSGLRIGYNCDQKAIHEVNSNHVFLRRLSRADVKGLYVRKLRGRYGNGIGLVEMEPVIVLKLCNEVVFRKDGVMFIQLPKEQVEGNLKDLPFPGVGGEIDLPLFDPVANKMVENMKLVLSDEEDQYCLGGGWEDYAAKHDLLISDTIFLDKVTVHYDDDQTVRFSCHYEITYQRKRVTEERDAPSVKAIEAKGKDAVVPKSTDSERGGGNGGDSSWYEYCSP